MTKLELVVFDDGKFGVRRTEKKWWLYAPLTGSRFSFACIHRNEGETRHYFRTKEFWKDNCHFLTLEQAKAAMEEYGLPVEEAAIDYGKAIP